MTFSNPIVGSAGVLIREAIKSPDYSPGVSGWSINRDGSAEFNDVTIRGELIVGTYPGGQYVRVTGDDPLAGPAVYFGTGNVDQSAPGYISASDLFVGLGLLLRGIENNGADPPTLDLISWNAPDPADVYAMGRPLGRPEGGWYSSAAAQAIPTGAVTTLTDWSTLQVNDGPLAGTAALTVAAGVATPKVPGVWTFAHSGRFAANATGLRMGYARDLSAVDQEVAHEFAPAVTQPSCFTMFWTDVYNGTTDTFRWRVFQNSGGNLNYRTQRMAAWCASL